MRKRSRFRDWLEYLAARFILLKLRWTPRPLAGLVARTYLRVLDIAVPRLRRIARLNLAMAFPEKPSEGRERIIDGVFRSLARSLLVFARLPDINRENVSQWIRYEGFHHFEEALRRGKGVLFATAHLGNWELSAFSHGLMTAPMHILVRHLDNPLLDALVERRRRLSGNHIIEKRDFARGILRALSRNEAVGILIDQNSSLDEGIFVDFFGVPACANTGLAKIAARSGATVIPGFALWSEQEHRYILRFYPPVQMTGDDIADTRQLQMKLEDVIREHPGQWLWIHRRWKTRPPGEPPIY